MQPVQVDRASIGANWAQRGFSCEIWVDPPNRVWHDVRHEVDLLLLPIDGELQVELPTRTIRLGAGDELAIPAHTRFTIRHRPDSSARWLHGYRVATA